MTIDEAKATLMLYRPGTTDPADPDIAAALALAKREPLLARWLDEQLGRQVRLQAAFRSLKPPPGLAEQIVSEHAAASRVASNRRKIGVLAAAATAVCGLILFFMLPRLAQPRDDTYANYQLRMVGAALRGYSMDLETNSPAAVRDFLSQRSAPNEYIVPEGLQRNAILTGCAVQQWQNARVSMICYRSRTPGTSAVGGGGSDLWLFIVDQQSLKDAPALESPAFARINRLSTLAWRQDGKIYLLGAETDETSLRRYL